MSKPMEPEGQSNGAALFAATAKIASGYRVIDPGSVYGMTGRREALGDRIELGDRIRRQFQRRSGEIISKSLWKMCQGSAECWENGAEARQARLASA